MLANIVNRKNQLKKLSLLLSFAFVAFFLSHPLLGIEYKGRANAWLLYLQDDFGATSVIDVYENASCSNHGEVDYVVIGPSELGGYDANQAFFEATYPKLIKTPTYSIYQLH